MFAVIKTGGKQYTVRAGDVLRVELIDAVAGDKVQFNEILMVGGETVTARNAIVVVVTTTTVIVRQTKTIKMMTMTSLA